MSDTEDPADAAIRLERALERIAAVAQRPRVAAAPATQADTARIAARLDTLITLVRAALGPAAE